jgi:hypothetical protein
LPSPARKTSINPEHCPNRGVCPPDLPGYSVMFSHEDFKSVTLADRAFFESHYALYPQIHSSNTFTNMICWNHFSNYRYTYVNGNVIISTTAAGVTRFRPPIGPHDPALMRALVRLALEDTPPWSSSILIRRGGCMRLIQVSCWCRTGTTSSTFTGLPTLLSSPESTI